MVAEAYASGNPLGLALYESDWYYHSGKYFVSSDTGDWNQVARPTLRILWGDPIGTVEQTASSDIVMPGDTLTYTLTIKGTGQPLTLTNELPAGVSSPISFNPALVYNSHNFNWIGNPAFGKTVSLTYAVTVLAASRTSLWNKVVLTQTNGLTSTSLSQVLVDPAQVYLPLVIKNRS
jgi:uncharacterized repeat protein (TIGR01451 family)